MPALHAIAAMAWSPPAVWVSSPRTVSAMGVKGWYSANWRSPAGIVAVDTRYRTGAESRISHLKRGYGRRRSLKGQAGMKTWSAWSILAYNLDTFASGPAESICTARSERTTICPERPRPTTTRPFWFSRYPGQVAIAIS